MKKYLVYLQKWDTKKNFNKVAHTLMYTLFSIISIVVLLFRYFNL